MDQRPFRSKGNLNQFHMNTGKLTNTKAAILQVPIGFSGEEIHIVESDVRLPLHYTPAVGSFITEPVTRGRVRINWWGLDLATQDQLQVIDLKTSRSRWKSGQAENQAEQLLLYSELAKQLAPDKKLRLRFAVITKTKTPTLEMHDVSVHPDRIDRTKRVVQRVWKSIQQGSFYPSPSPMACPSCAYQQACRDWQG